MTLQTPPYPLDPHTHAIHLPSDVVHALFHLAVTDGNKGEAVKRVMDLTGANRKSAQAYVEHLVRRR